MSHATAARRMGYFGGSFNPIHNGHLALAQAALHELALDGLLIMPTKNPPHKGALEISDQDRLMLARLTLGQLPKAHVSTIEIDGTGNQYTIETLEALGAREPGAPRFTLILGSDSFLSLPTWRRVDELTTMVDIAVAARGASHSSERNKTLVTVRDYAQKLASTGTKVTLMSQAMPEVSSTTIRQLWARLPSDTEAQNQLARLVPPAVMDYLKSTVPSGTNNTNK
jgi:nicotinate-nucleotide adenylyltransferase